MSSGPSEVEFVRFVYYFANKVMSKVQNFPSTKSMTWASSTLIKLDVKAVCT